MVPRLTEVFLIKEAPQKLTFQQLKQKNPEAASAWEEVIARWDIPDMPSEKNNPDDYEFAQDGARIMTADEDSYWNPHRKSWDFMDTATSQEARPWGSPKVVRA